MDVGVSLLGLVIIGRAYRQEGLGIFSFLLSLFIIGSYLFEFGVGKFIEKELSTGQINTSLSSPLFIDAQRATRLSAIGGGLAVFIFAGIHGATTQVGQYIGVGYLLAAAAVYINILGSFNFSVLHGLGRHEAAARISMTKRIVYLVIIFLLVSMKVHPALLMAAIVLAEMVASTRSRKAAKFPAVRNPFREMQRTSQVFTKASQFYFTDEAFRMVIFLDFFILGFFVAPRDLGTYSEASVLARLFLIIPLGAAPVFRTRYYRLAAEKGMPAVLTLARRTAANLFTLHSLSGLAALVYFPLALRFLFKVQTGVPVSFKVFTLLLPGLLYLGSAVIMEPVYTVSGQRGRLGTAALRIFILNAFLNFYLIPFAGLLGAASATSISFIVYFLFFGKDMGEGTPLPNRVYLVAGILVYLGYQFLESTRRPVFLMLPVVALVIWVLFWMVGLYGWKEKKGPGEEGWKPD